MLNYVYNLIHHLNSQLLAERLFTTEESLQDVNPKNNIMWEAIVTNRLNIVTNIIYFVKTKQTVCFGNLLKKSKKVLPIQREISRYKKMLRKKRRKKLF